MCVPEDDDPLRVAAVILRGVFLQSIRHAHVQLRDQLLLVRLPRCT